MLRRRFGDNCWLCGKVVEKGIPGGHPMRASIDHVPRKVRFEKTTPDNSRLAHMICNAVRSNPNPPLLKFVERYLSEFGVDILAAWNHGQLHPDGSLSASTQ